MAALAVGLAKPDVVDALMNRGRMAGFFFGDLCALLAALVGALVGSGSEAKAPSGITRPPERGRTPFAPKHAAQPT